MSELAVARHRRCQRCAHKLMRPGAGWVSPHCDFSGGDLELTDGFLEGPDGNCPAGLWAGLEPVDLRVRRAAREEAALSYQRAALKPIILAGLRWMGGPEAQGGFLVDLVAEGWIAESVAQECAEEGAVDLDSP